MGDPRIIINKLYRTLLLSVLVVALLGASVPSASAKTPPSITVMTQNLYQGTEFTNSLATTTLPILFAGDFNSDPTGQAYSEAAGAGFIDRWTEANGDAGYTAFQVLPTINNANSNLSTRIDYILARGSFAPQHLSLVGADPSARTSSGLWPSDHAGVVGTFKLGGS